MLFTFSAVNPKNCDAQQNYGFSFGTGFGFVHGQALELVYPTNTLGSYLSELIWEMKPVSYIGFQLDFGRTNIMSAPGVFASMAFKIGIPGDSGNHENRDWMSTENSNLTHFSSHTNRTNKFFWIDVSAGASIPLMSYFYIKPFLSGSWMHFAFSGSDGYGIYARRISTGRYHPIDDRPDSRRFSGEVIRYQQDWLFLAAGFLAGTNYFYPLTFDITFQISPLTYCAARDDHLYMVHRIYHDFTSYGLFIEPRARISFFASKAELSLEAAYRHIGRTRGITFWKQGNSEVYIRSANDSGAGLSLADLRFLIKFNLY